RNAPSARGYSAIRLRMLPSWYGLEALAPAQYVHVVVVLALAAGRNANGSLDRQEFRRDRYGDFSRALAADACEADRAGDAADQAGRQSRLPHALLETAALGARADQAEIGEVAAAQDGFADVVVERVAMRHDEVVRAGRHRRGFAPRIGALDHHHVAGRGVGEHPAAAVDPPDLAIEAGHRGDDGRAGVPGAEERDGHARRTDGFEQHGNLAAVAGPDVGPPCRSAFREQAPRNVRHLVRGERCRPVGAATVGGDEVLAATAVGGRLG